MGAQKGLSAREWRGVLCCSDGVPARDGGARERHRIERALDNLGYQRHPGRTVINLAPADLRKDAGGFDLPIALGLLVATGQLLPEQLREFATVGELALDGSVRPIKGALSMAMAAGEHGIHKLLVPVE